MGLSHIVSVAMLNLVAAALLLVGGTLGWETFARAMAEAAWVQRGLRYIESGYEWRVALASPSLALHTSGCEQVRVVRRPRHLCRSAAAACVRAAARRQAGDSLAARLEQGVPRRPRHRRDA